MILSPKKVVIFDLDGTLFNTETVDVPAINEALLLHGYPEKDKDSILSYIGFPLPEIAEALLGTDDPHVFDSFSRDVIRFETKWIEQAGQLYPGALEFLSRLKDKGITLCICTNGNKVYVSEIARKFEFNLLFDEILYRKEGITKSQAVESIIRKYGDSSLYAMVGDRSHDFDAAKENSIPSIGVTHGYGNQELESADHVADSFIEAENIISMLLKAYPRE
jgi:phosphoglycolate phosphatase